MVIIDMLVIVKTITSVFKLSYMLFYIVLFVRK